MNTPLNGQFSLLLSVSVLINKLRLYPQISKQTLCRPWWGFTPEKVHRHYVR